MMMRGGGAFRGPMIGTGGFGGGRIMGMGGRPFINNGGFVRGGAFVGGRGGFVHGGNFVGRPFVRGGFVGGRGFVGPVRFFRPYYAFRPRTSLGFGFWAGYPFAYPYAYYYPSYYPSYSYSYPYAYSSVTPYDDSSSYSDNSIEAQPSQGDTGGLSFDVTPGTAQLFVDGSLVGTVGEFTPTTQPLGLAAGRHHVEVRAPGYHTMSFDVDIAAGQVIPYQGTLEQE